MSGDAGWLHPTTAEGSTRLYMVGAFVGAVLLLGFSVVAGWPIAPGRAAQDPAALAASAAAGTCLTWTRPDAGDLAAVPCGQPHLFEVTGSADISAQYPAGAAMPDEAAWQKAAQNGCTASATNYIGKLDPTGKYVVGALKPTGGQWNSGDRTLRCGLQRSTPAGQLLATTGSARGADQSNVYPAGTCLALVNKAAGGPVPCGDQHAYEIVGVVDLHGKFPDGYPPIGQQQTELGKDCQPMVAAYTANANLATNQLSATWDTISAQSWAAGSFQVNCKIGALLPDGSGLGPVTNSVKGIGRGAAPGTASTPATPSG
ncbi:MAG TPA: septum formation family protein [Pseudonocardiaceae bacterium]|nr:septum formation family protein [Pseudonocardiaceae bacterium]